MLSRILFPEAARFFGDSLLGPGMLRLASELIDSNILKKDVFQVNLEGIMHTAKAQLMQLKKNKDEYPIYIGYVIDVLGKINNKQSIGFLNAFVKMGDLTIKQNAVLALLKNKQTISPAEIHTIAADKAYRTSFYNALKEIGKQELFPPQFLTQQQFAEGYVYNNASDEDANNIVCKLVGERVASIKGVQERFYLFKVSFGYDGEIETHLVICGRFDMNRKKVELKEDDLSLRIFYAEKYTPATINKLYDEFITAAKNEAASSEGK